MPWRPFSYDGITYDLSHLQKIAVEYHQAAKEGKPERMFGVQVSFSSHCFTRGLNEGEGPLTPLAYHDGRDYRIFDFQRYEFSKKLPEIVRDLGSRPCFHTGHRNFLAIEVLDADGNRFEYEVYFRVRLEEKRLLMTVESAYVRDNAHEANRPNAGKIGLFVILFNTLNKRPIKPPRK